MANAARPRNRSRYSFATLATKPIALAGSIAARLARDTTAKDSDPETESTAVELTPPLEVLPPELYRIKVGDTIYQIAADHDMSTAALLATNGLSWKTPIFPGEILWLVKDNEADGSHS